MVLIEYYEEFEEYKGYTRGFVNPTLAVGFEAYLLEKGISLEDAFDSVDDFTGTLGITKKTMRNYRTRLRRFVEYVQEKEKEKKEGGEDDAS